MSTEVNLTGVFLFEKLFFLLTSVGIFGIMCIYEIYNQHVIRNLRYLFLYVFQTVILLLYRILISKS